MCNYYTGEHTFIASGDTSTTAVNNLPYDWQRCSCGQFTWGQLHRAINDWYISRFAYEQFRNGCGFIDPVHYPET